jgi:hypothetical protein
MSSKKSIWGKNIFLFFAVKMRMMIYLLGKNIFLLSDCGCCIRTFTTFFAGSSSKMVVAFLTFALDIQTQKMKRDLKWAYHRQVAVWYLAFLRLREINLGLWNLGSFSGMRERNRNILASLGIMESRKRLLVQRAEDAPLNKSEYII